MLLVAVGSFLCDIVPLGRFLNQLTDERAARLRRGRFEVALGNARH